MQRGLQRGVETKLIDEHFYPMAASLARDSVRVAGLPVPSPARAMAGRDLRTALSSVVWTHHRY